MRNTVALLEALQQRGIESREATAGDAFDGAQPRAVASPHSTDEVSTALREATSAGATVLPRGNGTKQTWGAPAPVCDLLLDLRGMDRLVEHQPGDLIATAQAGMPLATLQEHLASASQRLALDEMVPGTTIGGLIATNPSGPRRLHAGTVRDLLIGITLVRADGTVAHAGGKVVKNVAGYDLCKLMTGSWGTLGVITEATFRLHPIPEAARWVSLRIPLADLAGTLTAALHSQLAPSALEVDVAAGGDASVVAALVEGTQVGVDARSAELADLLGEGAVLEDPAEGYPFAVGGDTIALKITCALHAVAHIVAQATGLGLHVRGSAGTGVLYAAAPEGVQHDVARWSDRLVALRRSAAAAGGSVTVVDGPRDARGSLDVWGPVHGLPLMRRIKDEFDPDHRLVPGRFVGGI